MKLCTHWITAVLVSALSATAAAPTARPGPKPAGLPPEVRGSFTRTLKVTGPVDLEVKSGSGDIRVRKGEQGTVEIRGRIQAHDRGDGERSAEEKVHYLEEHPPIVQEGNRLRVGRIDDADLRRNVSIDYEITVPVETQLSSETGSGDLTVEGLHGTVNARTGSGDLNFDSINGDVRVKTGSGDGRFERMTGRLELETGSGDFELRDLRCSLDLRTGSGDVKAEGEPTGDWSLHTGSGEVTVRLPSALAFDLDAHTSSGEISASGLAIVAEGTIGHGALRGKVRGGGVRVELRTGSGDIRIE